MPHVCELEPDARNWKVSGGITTPCGVIPVRKDSKSITIRTQKIGGAVARQRECVACSMLTDTIEVTISSKIIDSLRLSNREGVGKWTGSIENRDSVMEAMGRNGLVVLLRPLLPAKKNRIL